MTALRPLVIPAAAVVLAAGAQSANAQPRRPVYPPALRAATPPRLAGSPVASPTRGDPHPRDPRPGGAAPAARRPDRSERGGRPQGPVLGRGGTRGRRRGRPAARRQRSRATTVTG